MFGQGIYGCENRKRKGGVASPIDFLCKIEISKFVNLSLIKETLQDIGTLVTLMNDVIQMIDESSCSCPPKHLRLQACNLSIRQ